MTLEEVADLVLTKPKMVGLKMIYRAFDVPKDKRREWCDLWDDMTGELDAANKKGPQNQGGNEEALRREKG